MRRGTPFFSIINSTETCGVQLRDVADQSPLYNRSTSHKGASSYEGRASQKKKSALRRFEDKSNESAAHGVGLYGSADAHARICYGARWNRAFFSFADLQQLFSNPTLPRLISGFAWRDRAEQTSHISLIECYQLRGNGFRIDGQLYPGASRPLWGY